MQGLLTAGWTFFYQAARILPPHPNKPKLPQLTLPCLPLGVSIFFFRSSSCFQKYRTVCALFLMLFFHPPYFLSLLSSSYLSPRAPFFIVYTNSLPPHPFGYKVLLSVFQVWSTFLFFDLVCSTRSPSGHTDVWSV